MLSFVTINMSFSQSTSSDARTFFKGTKSLQRTTPMAIVVGN